MDMRELVSEVLEGLRRTGRTGGAVLLVLGILQTAGALTSLPEEDEAGYHYAKQRKSVALGAVVGIVMATGGMLLLVSGGASSRRSRAPRAQGDLEDAVSTLPFPFSFCLRCPRIVKSWTMRTCSRCGGDLVEVRDEADAEWIRGELRARR